MRRDFKAVLSLIQAHAVLHQMNREVDDRGRIVATLEDYNAVRDLVHDSIAESTGVKVPKTVRDTVQMVETLRGPAHTPVTYGQLCQAMGPDKGTISKRVSQAIQLGLLVNLETHKWMPAQLVLGDPMREDGEVLPRLREDSGGKKFLEGVSVDCNTATPPEKGNDSNAVSVASPPATPGNACNTPLAADLRPDDFFSQEIDREEMAAVRRELQEEARLRRLGWRPNLNGGSSPTLPHVPQGSENN